jgi:GT2 family glycosyltransferase
MLTGYDGHESSAADEPVTRTILPRSAAVVVVWRDASNALEAVASLRAMPLCPETIICVVQEATVPESWRALEPGIRVVELSDNYGFAHSIDLGVSLALEAGAEWILLLNDDAVVEPSCLARCVQEAQSDSSVAAVGPAVVFGDRPDTIWFAGGRHSDDFLYTRHHALGRTVDKLPVTSDTDYIAGCCMLVRADAWRALGGFREDFFLYYEDVEWCLRARNAGWRCRYVAEVLCRHRAGSSTQDGQRAISATSAYYRARNPLRFARETKSLRRRVTRTAGVLLIRTPYFVFQLIRAHDRQAGRAYLQGLRDGLGGRMGRGPWPREMPSPT